MRILITLLIFTTLIHGNAPRRMYPAGVESALKKAGKNRKELEKAIDFFLKDGDAEKLKATFFLIENMDCHFSKNYIWQNQDNTTLKFDELAYPNFDEASSALSKLKNNHPGLRAKVVTESDLEHVTGDFLISNIEEAFKAWRSSSFSKIPFESFCEYILPYRVSVEPLQTWRKNYGSQFHWLTKAVSQYGFEDALIALGDNYKGSFASTFKVESRFEPLPRLGAMQLLFRKKGACEDVADLEAFSLRSQGIPASVDFIPLWATTSGGHFFNITFDKKMKSVAFDVYRSGVVNKPLTREPGKVLRMTFTKQPDAIASRIPLDDIPPNFLRLANYKDVTSQYWPTKDVTCSLVPVGKKHAIAYLGVFNALRWQPTWWADVKNGSALFSNMSKGAVFLPLYYEQHKLSVAGYPIALGYKHEAVLKPDLNKRRVVVLNEQPNYLKYKAGKKYTLYYWDNHWRNAGSKTADMNTKALIFTKVPANALLIMLSSEVNHNQRPFIINDDGARVWF